MLQVRFHFLMTARVTPILPILDQPLDALAPAISFFTSAYSEVTREFKALSRGPDAHTARVKYVLKRYTSMRALIIKRWQLDQGII